MSDLDSVLHNLGVDVLGVNLLPKRFGITLDFFFGPCYKGFDVLVRCVQEVTTK
jgi:hypothetical protein